MLAPIVAIVPIGDLGGPARAVGVAEERLPRCRPSVSLSGTKGVRTEVIKAIVDDNCHALLIGFLSLLIAAIVVLILNRRSRHTDEVVEKNTMRSVVAMGGALVLLWALSLRDDFSTAAHTPAAVTMFLFLVVVVAVTAWERRQSSMRAFVRLHAGIALAMPIGGFVIALLRTWLFRDHTTFALEAWEIGLFVRFWTIQTAEHWNH